MESSERQNTHGRTRADSRHSKALTQKSLWVSVAEGGGCSRVQEQQGRRGPQRRSYLLTQAAFTTFAGGRPLVLATCEPAACVRRSVNPR
jgi:hypothetical protein